MRHRRAAQNLEHHLTREAGRIVEHEPEPRQLHRRLADDVRRQEAHPQPAPLQGVRFDAEEARYDLEGSRGRERLRYRYSVGPNMARGTIDVLAVPPRMSQRPTRSLQHWLLRNASPPIRNLGPYELNPNQVFRTVGNVPAFRITMLPRGWNHTSREGSTRIWDACLRVPAFDPEQYSWDNTRNRYVKGRIGTTTQRTDALKNEIAGNTLAGRAPQPEINAMLRHDRARTPRDVGGVAEESAIAPGIHFIDNHILGMSPGVRTRRELAVRAVFNVIPAGTGWTGTAPTNRSSAFNTPRGGAGALRRVRAALTREWWRKRLEIVRAPMLNPVFQSYTEITSLGGIAYTAYKRMGGLKPIARLPAYLYPAGTGGRVLIPGDQLSRQWIAWAAAPRIGDEPADLNPNTILEPRANITARIKRSRTHGWYVLTMFPS